MSLINDALKRAQKTQRNNPPPGAPPLTPVESRPRGGAGWILAAAAVLFLAAACLFAYPMLFGHTAAPVAAVKRPVIAVPSPVPVPVPMPAPVLPKTVRATNSPTPPLVATKSAPPAATTATLPKVQGIIFNAARPVAIVDGKSVGVGSRAGIYQVTEISLTNVTFQRPDGSKIKLGIGK